MRFLRLNESVSQCFITYWLPGKVGQQSRTTATVPLATGWPAFRAMLDLPNHKILRPSVNSLTQDECLAGFSVYTIEPGDHQLPPKSELSYTIEQAPTKVPSKRYRERFEAGEVLMNDYARGTIRVKRSASYNYTGGTLLGNGPTFGWLRYTSVFPCARPTYDQRQGETIKNVSVYIQWDVISNPGATYDLSPDPLFTTSGVELDTELITSVVADCNNGTFDLLTEMVELPETLTFVTDLTKKAAFIGLDAEAEHRMAKKNMPVEKFARWSANHWLKMRYALLPIFYSIADVSKVLKDMGREYAEYKRQKAINGQVPIDLMSGALTVSVEGDCTHRCFIRSRYTPDSLISDFRRMININLFSSAWELTKLSFVWDWVFNVGDFLSAATGNDGSTDSKCCYSVRDNRKVTLSYSNASDRPVTTVEFNTYMRQVINPIDHIGLTTRFDMNWKRYIDAASLSLKPVIKTIRSLK